MTAAALGCTSSQDEHSESHDAGVLFAFDAWGSSCDGFGSDALSSDAFGSDAFGSDATAVCNCMPSRAVSFANDVQPIFQSCTGEVCHSAQWADPAVAYASLVGQPSKECCGERPIVSPCNPEQSYLYQKISGVDLCGGARMPLEAAPLSSQAIATIYDWICSGAPHN